MKIKNVYFLQQNIINFIIIKINKSVKITYLIATIKIIYMKITYKKILSRYNL